MSILTGPEIQRIVERTRQHDAGCISHATADGEVALGPPFIRIEPFDPELLGPNSYDVALGSTLLVYRTDGGSRALDSRAENPVDLIPIHGGGVELVPGKLYLGHTAERIACEGLVPYIDGRSSFGRLGLSVHVTAGRGDDGWDGQLTLELTVVEPLRVYAGDLVGQVTFHTIRGERRPYCGRYVKSKGPVASRAHQKRPE